MDIALQEADDVSTIPAMPLPSMSIQDTPLPATPPLLEPALWIYKMVRETSQYNNPPPITLPPYMDPELPMPPDVCPGVHTSPVEKQSRIQVDLPDERDENAASDTGNGMPKPGIPPYYNAKAEYNQQRAISTVSSDTGYGQAPAFQNEDVIQELVRMEGRDSLSPSPTYINAQAELDLHARNSVNAEPPYEKITFENEEILNDIAEDDATDVEKSSHELAEINDSISDEGKVAIPNTVVKKPESVSGNAKIPYVNAPSEHDFRPLSTVSSEPDYSTFL